MAEFAPTADDMLSLVAELQAAGAQAQHQAEQQAARSESQRRTFDCRPSALVMIVGHNGDRLRGMEAATGARIRAVTDKWAPLGATVMVESADPARLDAAEDLVRKSLELAKSPQRIPVARQALGRVIGRNGERIKSVNERSGAKCSVNQEGDPCYVVVESEDPMRIQVAREMIASFMESSTAKLWVVEEAARGKAESALHGAFAGLPSPLAPAQQAFATAPVNGEPAPTQAIDPYKHADLAWASARDPAGRTYYYNAMTGQSTWEKPPGFSE